MEVINSKKSILIKTLISLLVISITSGCKNRVEETTNIAFINGSVFTGKKFIKKNIYSIDGVITFKKPASIDSTINVDSKFIVAPYGEAHNHNLGDEGKIDQELELYLSQGVFYSKNLHYLPGRTQKIKDRINIPNSVDVIYAHTGIVATGGHVHTLYNNLYNWKVLNEFNSIEELDTKAYLIVDNKDDLETKWKALMDMNPGIIKAYLEYSDEYELRKNDPKYADEKGLNPDLLEMIVAKANSENLNVSVHIESVEDFRNAIKAGVYEIAHLPGFRISKFKSIEDYKLTKQDAIDAKNAGVQIISTTVLSNSMNKKSPDTLQIIKKNQLENLRLLKDNGVKIVIGSDMMNSTSIQEVMNLHQFKVFSNLELLKILSEDTPRNIFPERKIGYLREGYEASFLILNGNPILQFEEIKNIEIRFKQGEFITE